MILSKIKDFKIYLASKSPRRQHLLKGLGFSFEVLSGKKIDENYPDKIQREDIPVFLAQKKANAYRKKLKDKEILITADTIVWMKNKVFNKPRNYNEAYAMLDELSSHSHDVITGVCITSKIKQESFFSETKVHFKSLDKQEINYYIHKYKPYDKAGAYGIQEWIGFIGIDSIEGSYFNVMGLPVQRLYEELKLFIRNN